jgi:hypothetical protein
MPDETSSPKNDWLAMVAVSALACILQDVLHEGLGHGVTAWLSGAHQITMSTVALQSDIETRWVSANGTLVNLATAAILWLLLLRPERYRPVTRYFLVLAMAGNFFTGTGYFLFSGVANFGDWKQVIAGLQPQWAWRLGLVVLGAASYYASMLLVAAKLRPFQGREPRVLRWVCWTPYFTDGVLAGVAALFSPLGLFYMIASALPSTLGANSGLLGLPSMMCRGEHKEDGVAIPRSVPWIAAGAIASAFFIVVLGHGITWSR